MPWRAVLTIPYNSVNTQLDTAAANGDRATEVASESSSAGDVGDEQEQEQEQLLHVIGVEKDGEEAASVGRFKRGRLARFRPAARRGGGCQEGKKAEDWRGRAACA